MCVKLPAQVVFPLKFHFIHVLRVPPLYVLLHLSSLPCASCSSAGVIGTVLT